MFWYSMRNFNYQPTVDCLSKHFKIDPQPLIWVKPGEGMVPDPLRRPRQIYETCLFGSRGDRKIVTLKPNAYVGGTDKSEDHPTAKPYAMLREFFPMFIDENSKVLDPTCGSGTALRAAKSLGAKYVLGIEKDPDFVERATRALEKWVQANGNGQSPTPMPPG
jgi:DNA modification methylase